MYATDSLSLLIYSYIFSYKCDFNYHFIFIQNNYTAYFLDFHFLLLIRQLGYSSKVYISFFIYMYNYESMWNIYIWKFNMSLIFFTYLFLLLFFLFLIFFPLSMPYFSSAYPAPLPAMSFDLFKNHFKYHLLFVNMSYYALIEKPIA